MVAIRNISPGELLVIERPVYSQSSLVSKLHSSQWSNIHLGSLEGLSDDSKKTIYALENRRTCAETCCHGLYLPVLPKLTGILESHFVPLEVDGSDDTTVFSGCRILPLMSRVNHDCTPNANMGFSSKTYAAELRAAMDIKAGQEITITFVDPAATVVQRGEALQSYGLHCTCNACVNGNSTDSDKRRVRIGEVVHTFEGDPMAVPFGIDELREVLELTEKEGLVGYRAQLLQYGGLELLEQLRLEEGKEWLRKAKEQYLIINGPEASAYKTLAHVFTEFKWES
ncbi:hypothetical protein BT96DRAFT_983628 [Gymnopus androsaceus JB14]|uniref:SET domain-containing protein n=1 Tax=Gymnopus androsaceus JB14 TaxID=1447944 RepID=A0A6A4IQ96_9AGAR|nr:hypothetical protein BT96DRAFT_983628 [Gymnopus androsaceus JB14]